MHAWMKAAGMILLGIGLASLALAQQRTPEIDAASAGNALALLGGALLIIRGRKR